MNQEGLTNEKVQKQLLRQMRIINFWISLFGSIVIIGIIVMIYILWQVMSFVHDTNKRIDNIKNSTTDSLNLQKKACEGTGSLADYFKKNTDICN